jgi:hypothetical protein
MGEDRGHTDRLTDEKFEVLVLREDSNPHLGRVWTGCLSRWATAAWSASS